MISEENSNLALDYFFDEDDIPQSKIYFHFPSFRVDSDPGIRQNMLIKIIFRVLK